MNAHRERVVQTLRHKLRDHVLIIECDALASSAE
jgi:hypothetical protein